MIPVAKPNLGEEEAAAIREVILSGWIAQGPKVKAFEEAFAAYLRLEPKSAEGHLGIGFAHGVRASGLREAKQDAAEEMYGTLQYIAKHGADLKAVREIARVAVAKAERKEP